LGVGAPEPPQVIDPIEAGVLGRWPTMMRRRASLIERKAGVVTRRRSLRWLSEGGIWLTSKSVRGGECGAISRWDDARRADNGYESARRHFGIRVEGESHAETGVEEKIGFDARSCCETTFVTRIQACMKSHLVQ
jgi:hypothetical protein